MHKILNRTHRIENINILKARDYYFDKARRANNVFRRICLFAPIAVTLICMIFGSIKNISDDDTWLDVIVGITAIVAFIIDSFIQKYIDDVMEKSNILREEYDCRVLGIKKNLFCGNNSDQEIEDLTKVSRLVPDSSKYEVWYRETFSQDDTNNAICMMMDNTIYTKWVYKDYKEQVLTRLLLLTFGFLMYTLWFISTPSDYFVAMVNPFMLFIALFDGIKELVGSYIVSKSQVKSTENLIDYVKNNKDTILSGYESPETILRSIEDLVISNREKSLFIPKRTRKKYLKNGNDYYKELDEIKTLYWGNDVSKPKEPKDYEIPANVTPPVVGDPPVIDVEHPVVNLEQVHEELLQMLDEVKQVLDEANIRFMLDGGTLIGAIRASNNNSFLPWDDDVDISIKSEDVSKAMEIIRNKLKDRYIVQDYKSENYYSPRLSRFRIRQLNTRSVIDEKDSEFFELYKSRGLFLDVYAFSPILVNRFVDGLYRVLIINPIHRRIRKAETQWKIKDKKSRSMKKYAELREKYRFWADLYVNHAACTKYYAYEPHYMEKGWKGNGKIVQLLKEVDWIKNILDNMMVPGPYIKCEDMYGKTGQERNYQQFENRTFEVPINPGAVLEKFYGENWEKSPYIDIKDIKAKQTTDSDGQQQCNHMYSIDSFDSSRYKHVKAIYIQDRVYEVSE